MKTPDQLKAAVADCEARMAELDARREGLKAELRAMEQERCLLLAQLRLAEMPEGARAALVLAAQGIASAEKAGVPGR